MIDRMMNCFVEPLFCVMSKLTVKDFVYGLVKRSVIGRL